MAEEVEADNGLETLKRSMQYPLIKNCDMNEEMRGDCVDQVVSAIEKHSANLELAAKMVKEYMDRKYNENWIVIIGKDFAFECTHEVKHVLWMFICDVSCLCYKAGARQVGTL